MAHAAARTITVAGSAEILTAPDLFEISAGFEVQTANLGEARDESKRRAARLLAVAERRQLPACDVQTHQLSLQPRYDNNYGEHRKLIGYEATRSLTLVLHDVEQVEAVLFELVEAGANRIDRVEFRSSKLTEKRAEARVLAVEAAREKAEAMAAALGQKLGEPLRVDEGSAPSWHAPMNLNYMVSNETVAQVSETVASGKIQVQAAVSVMFRLQG
ncbi:MAG: SIMPL domain-containing protein [Myxococcales bacterium]|nr:SIMPL domain-containing protein [Myxococcales bacterium]